jgi:hypothetical protein
VLLVAMVASAKEMVGFEKRDAAFLEEVARMLGKLIDGECGREPSPPPYAGRSDSARIARGSCQVRVVLFPD